MPIDCSPNSLSIDSACFSGFNHHGLLSVIATALCNAINGTSMNCSPNDLSIAAACFNGVNDKKLMEIIASLMCQLANGGGGGGGAAQVFSGHYAGGVPTDVPTTSAAIADDLDAPFNHWVWDGAAWT